MRSMRLLVFFVIIGVSTVWQDGAEAWSCVPMMKVRGPLFTFTISGGTTPKLRQPFVVDLVHNMAADSTTEDPHDEEEEGHKKNRSTTYEPPQFSDSFLKRMEQVRASWPTTPENDGGVECTGEPAMDPSRQIQALDLQDSDWMDW